MAVKVIWEREKLSRQYKFQYIKRREKGSDILYVCN